jgi:uncharacterized protein (TIGR03437 family)
MSFAGCTRLQTRVPVLAVCLMATAGIALAQDTIQTFAGNGQTTFAGDGGMALNAALNLPKGLAIDGAGNIYIADTQNFRVRKVNPAGMITTVAGNGVNAGSGDGGQALNASISDVTGVAVDPAGNLYITDDSSRRIRKVTPNGIITTIAGLGVQGFSGDGGPATAALVGRAVAVALDSAGNLYFADSVNQRVRKIDRNGIITTVAGTGIDGYTGDGGPATAAQLGFPIGVAVDGAGNLYIADGDNNRVRKVTPAGIISTVAGNGNGGFAGDGGQAINASINIPSDLAVDAAGNLYIADAGNNRVRRVDTSGIITTVAGTSDNGYSGDGGSATQAMLNYPWGLAVDPSGRVYIGDRVNSRVRSLSAAVAATPSLAGNAVLNGASFTVGEAIAPGSVVSIFGSNFALGTSQDLGAPLPFSLSGTTVTFNGKQVPLFFVSQTQINVQAPFDLPLGQVSIQVQRGSSTSATVTEPVAMYSPGIFMVDFNANVGAIVHTVDYSVVTAANPAKPGDSLAIFATGLGPVNQTIVSGQAAPSVEPLARTTSMPTVTIGGVQVNPSYAGLAPGFVGLYQVNVVVPTGVNAGTASVQINSGGMNSNTAQMAVGH